MSKAAVCRTFGVKRATLYDTVARHGRTGALSGTGAARAAHTE